MGWNRISKNTPATTMVLECNRADTGVGPSIAAGSQGCKPNCADFPAAARIRPRIGRVRLFCSSINTCWSSHVFIWIRNHAIESTKPMSPIRLYRMACRAAVLASARPYHQPINKNDMMPTPSQPMKSWKRLLAVTRIIIVIRNRRRYLKKRLMLGSECIYHRENSIMDHVTNSATGINNMEKKSSFRLIESLMVLMVVQCQFDNIISWLVYRNIIVGIRLIIKASETEFFT